MSSFRRLFLMAALVCSCGVAGADPNGRDELLKVDTASLLKEMIDLSGLSEYPDPPFICRQFSSYDRKSVSPDQEWFANHDRGQYLRVEQNQERDEYVMMDADGPGAVVRIWSANPAGTLRIYLDGATEPVIETPLTDFLSGKTAGFPEPIAHVASRGWNSYFPIPYSKHCKMTSDAGDFYYQINYRTYPAGTRVEAFDREAPVKLAGLVKDVIAVLDAPRSAPLAFVSERQGLTTGLSHKEKERIDPGDHMLDKIMVSNGGAVCGLEARVEAKDLDAALRGVVLSLEFDGQRTVQVPLGDFFGSAPGLSTYGSLPTGMDEDGTLWCRWWMPFRRSFTLRLDNFTQDTITADVRSLFVKKPWSERSMYFHAKWRIDKQVPTRPMIDWNYLVVTGKGVFVGDALYVSNPSRIWWGEGDEKIYVDGETFPSHFGTGTEDYYGYAWCCPELFINAYHNQPRCDGPGNYGHTAVNRWHVLDCIPFHKDFRFDMEIWHWRDVKVDYALAAYWYAFPGQTDNFPDPTAHRSSLVLDLLPPYQPFKVEGAQEGEDLEVVTKTGITEQQGAGEKYSNEAQLWWREAAVGDTLVLAFESAVAGPHHVKAVFTKANDYGIHKFAVNGQAVGKPFDLYQKGQWGPTEEIDLGVFDLSKGRNLFSVTILGKNMEAVPNYMFGLDYIRITE